MKIQVEPPWRWSKTFDHETKDTLINLYAKIFIEFIFGTTPLAPSPFREFEPLCAICQVIKSWSK